MQKHVFTDSKNIGKDYDWEKGVAVLRTDISTEVSSDENNPFNTNLF